MPKIKPTCAEPFLQWLKSLESEEYFPYKRNINKLLMVRIIGLLGEAEGEMSFEQICDRTCINHSSLRDLLTSFVEGDISRVRDEGIASRQVSRISLRYYELTEQGKKVADYIINELENSEKYKKFISS